MNNFMQKSPLVRCARDIAARLRSRGFQALFAGGCVRDLITGREPKDIDIVTDARPDRVLDLFPGSVAVGKAFGVVRVAGRQPGCERTFYDVATFRRDGPYSDGRHPRSIAFAEERADAQRRDFTINAMFYDPVSGEVRDHVGGREDIAQRIIRTVGDPQQRFKEDHLRMLRAVRFAATLSFSIESDTARAIAVLAPLIRRVSVERIQQELSRILLESARPGDAFETLSSLGLLKEIIPELEEMRGQEQPPQFHPEGDVWTHTVMMLNAMSLQSGTLGAEFNLERRTRLAWSVLLHDVGKPGTAVSAPDRIRFHRHASLGAEMSAAILQRLRLPAADIKAVSYIVGNHMRFMDVRRMRRSTLRRLITAGTFPEELELHRLDCMASHGDMQNYDFLKALVEQYKSEPVLPEPLINGADIIALGVPRGPLVGRLKQAVYDAQLDSQFDNRAAALKWLNKLIASGAERLA